eukprot:1148716-Pelagomonas_calceolata.AAC.6
MVTCQSLDLSYKDPFEASPSSNSSTSFNLTTRCSSIIRNKAASAEGPRLLSCTLCQLALLSSPGADCVIGSGTAPAEGPGCAAPVLRVLLWFGAALGAFLTGTCVKRGIKQMVHKRVVQHLGLGSKAGTCNVFMHLIRAPIHCDYAMVQGVCQERVLQGRMLREWPIKQVRGDLSFC